MEQNQNNEINQTISLENPLEEEVDRVNIYPVIRHLFLIIIILLTISIAIFLFYQNGKSIYDNGL